MYKQKFRSVQIAKDFFFGEREQTNVRSTVQIFNTAVLFKKKLQSFAYLYRFEAKCLKSVDQIIS